MRFVFVLAFSVAAMLELRAGEAELQFDNANELYRAGEYLKSTEIYEQIIANGYESASLFYNLGNAYFKQKNIPAAILSYERAKRLAPHDEDIAYNLRLANLRVVDKIEPIPEIFLVSWWKGLLAALASDGWAMLAIVASWVGAIGGAAIFVFRSIVIQRLVFFGLGLALVVTLFSHFAAFRQAHIEQSEQYAIVFAPSVSVKSAPDPQSTDLFVLHEGVKVDLLDSVGGWRKIRLGDGKVGWMTEDNLRVI